MINITVNTSDIDKAIGSFNSEEFLQMSIACVSTKLSLGTNSFSNDISRGQSNWRPLSNEYLKRKSREGYDLRIWVRTRNTFEALVNNIPTSTGTVNGLNFEATKGSGKIKLSLETLNKKAIDRLNKERPLFEYDANEENEMSTNIEKEIENIFVDRGFRFDG